MTDSESGTPGSTGAGAGALHEYLASRDVHCPACGYNLRGLRAERCPECSLALSLSLDGACDVGSGLIAALAGWIVGAGSGAVLLVLLIVLTLWFGEGAPPPQFFLLPIGVLVVGSLPAVWLGSRSGRAWFGGQPRGVRAGLAVLAWCYPPFAVFLYFLGVISVAL